MRPEAPLCDTASGLKADSACITDLISMGSRLTCRAVLWISLSKLDGRGLNAALLGRWPVCSHTLDSEYTLISRYPASTRGWSVIRREPSLAW